LHWRRPDAESGRAAADPGLHAAGRHAQGDQSAAGGSGIVRGELGGEPTDGTLYLFLNRRRDRLKLLHFAEGGWWLYYRVLEAGTFEELKSRGDNLQLRIDATQLMMLLSGVALVAAERRRRRLAAPAA
jgi:transposase